MRLHWKQRSDTHGISDIDREVERLTARVVRLSQGDATRDDLLRSIDKLQGERVVLSEPRSFRRAAALVR